MLLLVPETILCVYTFRNNKLAHVWSVSIKKKCVCVCGVKGPGFEVWLFLNNRSESVSCILSLGVHHGSGLTLLYSDVSSAGAERWHPQRAPGLYAGRQLLQEDVPGAVQLSACRAHGKILLLMLQPTGSGHTQPE